MTEEEYKKWYQSKIPIFCPFRSAQEHVDKLLLCWTISHGLMRNRAVEGPQMCHTCELAVTAKRWKRVWYRRFKNGTLPYF